MNLRKITQSPFVLPYVLPALVCAVFCSINGLFIQDATAQLESVSTFPSLKKSGSVITAVSNKDDLKKVFEQLALVPEVMKPVKRLQELYDESDRSEDKVRDVRSEIGVGVVNDQNIHEVLMVKLANEIAQQKRDLSSYEKGIARVTTALAGGDAAISEYAWILRQQKLVKKVDEELADKTTLERFVNLRKQQKVDVRAELDSESQNFNSHQTELNRMESLRDNLVELEKREDRLSMELLTATNEVLESLANVPGSEEMILKWNNALFAKKKVLAKRIKEAKHVSTAKLTILRERLMGISEQVSEFRHQLADSTDRKTRAKAAIADGVDAADEFVWRLFQQGAITETRIDSVPADEQSKTLLKRFVVMQEQTVEDMKELHDSRLSEFQRTQAELKRLETLEWTKNALSQELEAVKKQIVALKRFNAS